MSKRSRRSEHDPLREILLRKRDELNQRIEERRHEIVMDQEPEDEVGLAMRNSTTKMAIANIEREVRTLAEIELSLRRIATGEYGICGVCGEPIPLARLKAIPWTRSCVECAGGGVSRNAQRQRIAHQADAVPTL